ncbi:MAG: hypothetical protein EBR62_04185 [Verrucomicrobia bacterium]|nr:hypothetical protein [Verrucomicrobiota bacterium]
MPLAFPILRDGNRQLSLQDATLGNLSIPAADNEPERNTYRAFAFGLAPTGAVNDLVALGGSATKLIRLKGIIVSGTATAATNVPIYIYKRTAAYVGGTPTAITRVAADTTDPASTATLNHYATAGATAGAGSMLDGCRLNLAPAANGSIDRFLFQYTWQNDKAPNLRGVNEFFAVGMNGTSFPAGGALDVALVWSEE